MSDLVTALGLAIVIEGAAYTLFPEAMKRMMIHVLGQPLTVLRRAGLVAVAIGLGLVWLIRG